MIRNVEVWRDQKALDEHMTHDHTITGRDARPRALGVLDSSSR
jgi:quinol monooxygenase YgiN